MQSGSLGGSASRLWCGIYDNLQDCPGPVPAATAGLVLGRGSPQHTPRLPFPHLHLASMQRGRCISGRSGRCCSGCSGTSGSLAHPCPSYLDW